MCTYKNIHQHTYCTNLAVQANEQSVAAQADEQSVRTAVNRWRKDRVKLTADSEKRTQNLIMIMVLKKNTKKNKLMADFEKRTQNLIMIMVWKKVDGRLWKKNTKLDYDYGFEKIKIKSWRRLWKKNTKLDYDYGFEEKNLTADFEKRTQNLIMIMV